MQKSGSKVTLPFYASRGAATEPSKNMEMPDEPLAARHVMTKIEDYHILDFNERLNTSSYVNVVFEPEEEKVALMGLKINLADQTVYPESFKLHNDTLNMIAKLWHCPKPDDWDDQPVYAGAGCVGSTEACLLGGIALKFRWREWYRKKNGLSEDEVRGLYPNMVITTCFQAAWEKLFKYMDIEPRFIVPSYRTFTMDPSKVKDFVDDKTIGVVCILGNHYGGQYDPVWDIDKAITELNQEKDFQVGIHVDAASGGFVAPFQDDCPAWDFRLDNVLSISASGHKFGNSCCGTGWIVWRQREGLSETVAINVSYLGGSADSYTLNFSRPAQGVYCQFYKLLRLGKSGYRGQTDNQMAVSQYLREGLQKMTHEGKPIFEIIDAIGQGKTVVEKVCLPVVTAIFHPDQKFAFDEINFQDVIAMSHWYVSAYRMSMRHPLTEHKLPLFNDMPAERGMFRVVVKSNLTMNMAKHLLKEVQNAMKYLLTHNIGANDSTAPPEDEEPAEMAAPAAGKPKLQRRASSLAC